MHCIIRFKHTQHNERWKCLENKIKFRRLTAAAVNWWVFPPHLENCFNGDKLCFYYTIERWSVWWFFRWFHVTVRCCCTDRLLRNKRDFVVWIGITFCLFWRNSVDTYIYFRYQQVCCSFVGWWIVYYQIVSGNHSESVKETYQC